MFLCSASFSVLFGLLSAVKFEDLVKPNEDTEKKLKLLYQIPDRERACFSEIATSEASFSADRTPSMSSVPSAKFSFQDIKSKVLKKEKCEETPVSKPAPAPALASAPSTRSVKRRKTIDPIIHLDSFEGLSADEIKEKTLSLQSTANLGIGQLHQLLKKREADLLDLQKLMDHRDGHYKQREELLTKEVKELAVLNEKLVAENGELVAKAEEEKRLVIEEAQNSAASSVYEAMFEMAKEAAAIGFSLPQWDAYGWDLHLGKPGETAQADSQAAETAEDDGKKVVEEGAGTPVGDEGVMQA